MKKLIAILVVFALVAGAAFAQANFAAGGATKATLFEGHSEADDPWTAFDSWFWVSADKTNDEGTMGAKGNISIEGTGTGRQGVKGGDKTYFYAWWQPIDQLFIKMGKVGEDGKYWTGAGILGWDFQSNDMLLGIDYNYYNGFAGAFLPDSWGFFDNALGDHNGFSISIIPMEMFHLNLGWTLNDHPDLVATYGSVAVQAVINLDIGEAAIGFKNYMDGAAGDTESVGMQIAGHWKMPIGDAMKIEAGVRLNTTKDDADDVYLLPLEIGLGFGYGSPWGDDFWLTARVGAAIPLEDYQPTVIGLGICPSYDLGIFRVYFPIDFGMVLDSDNAISAEDSLIGWGINPYIRKQMGGLEVWAGFKVWNGANGNGTDSIAGMVRDKEDGAWAVSVLDKATGEQVNYAVQMGFLWSW